MGSSGCLAFTCIVIIPAIIATALIVAAVSWWCTGDWCWVFVQLAHSYHSCHPPSREAC